MTDHKENVIKTFAHDYRDMKMTEPELENMLITFVESLECEHQCSGNCRRGGCNCKCGEYHFN